MDCSTLESYLRDIITKRQIGMFGQSESVRPRVVSSLFQAKEISKQL